uniref:Putative ARID DNA-binding domain, Zinc finger, CCHC-type n=1 Tax=Helianthus annuus TaxID=4232 RepID=A0A251UHJ1_HELAN
MKPTIHDVSAANRFDVQQSGIRATSESDADLRPTSSTLPCKHCSDEKRERRWLQRRCYYCNKPGHQISTCKMKENDEETQLIRLAIDTGTQQQQNADFDHQSNQRMEYIVVGTDGGFWSEMWCVSKTLKHHYSGSLDMFKRIKNMSGVETKTGENQFFFIRGIGVVEVMSGSEKVRIQSVFYTPDIDRNLLSLDQLITQGFTVKFIGDKCKLFPTFSIPLINKKSDLAPDLFLQGERKRRSDPTDSSNMKVGIQKQEGVINDHQEMIVICTEGGQWGDIWYISSIFSHHIAGNLNVFKRIKHIVGVDTRSGENSFLFTRGVGAVEIKSSNETMRIQSVFYSPELDRNVLSLDQLTLQGYTVNKSGDTCKIFPMFSTPVINSVNDMSGLTKEDEIGLKELQGILDVSTMDDEFKERYLNSYFEELNLSSQETDWSLMIIKTMEFHEFADCKSLLDMIDDREFIFKYKHVLEAKFEEMVTRFLNVNMGISSRPVPPYAPTKRKIDLLGLYVTVERDGGYRSVTNDNSWPVVAKDLGYDYQDGLKWFKRRCLTRRWGKKEKVLHSAAIRGGKVLVMLKMRLLRTIMLSMPETNGRVPGTCKRNGGALISIMRGRPLKKQTGVSCSMLGNIIKFKGVMLEMLFKLYYVIMYKY